MDQEVFVPIDGFSSYLVSNYGTIKNAKTGRIKKWIKNSSNHYYVFLTPDGYKNYQKHKFVHRLVANAFMINPDPIHMDSINHIDEDPSNNRLDNLEFCDREWNANWATAMDRQLKTKKARGQMRKVYAINKYTQKVLKFSSLKEASKYVRVSSEQIGQVLDNPKKKIGGDYVFCNPDQYTEEYALKLIKNSQKGVRSIREPIIVINVNTKQVLSFNSPRELGNKLHLRSDYAVSLLKDPTQPNPYPYVFCLKSKFSRPYVRYLLEVYTKKEKQAIPIVGMNINTKEIREFDSIKQAEHQLGNQSVQPYLSGKVKSAKDWVFCKKSEYTKKLLQQRAKEAKPNNNFEIVILDYNTGNTIHTTSKVSDLAKQYGISVTTIRNQLNHNAVSIKGQQFIYADKFNEGVKQSFIDMYNKGGRGHAIYAIDIHTYQVQKFNSLNKVASSLGISKDRVQSALTGESNQTSGYAFCRESYYSKFNLYKLAYIGKWGKEGFPVSSVDSSGRITFYESAKDAANKLGLDRNNILRVVRGERKTYKGLKWFKEDQDKYIQQLVKSK